MDARVGLLVRGLRAAGVASAAGVAIMTFFRLLTWIGNEILYWRGQSGVAPPYFLHQNLPKAEEFGWLVGVLVFLALALTPLPTRAWWAASLVRALALGLAATLPLHYMAAAMTSTGEALAWLFVLPPLAGALVLHDWWRARVRAG